MSVGKKTPCDVVGPTRQGTQVHGGIDLAGLVIIPPTVMLDAPLKIGMPIASIDLPDDGLFFAFTEKITHVRQAGDLRLLDSYIMDWMGLRDWRIRKPPGFRRYQMPE